MASNKHVILTTIGKTLKGSATIKGNSQLLLKYFAVGDAGGKTGYFDLDENQDRLINELWRDEVMDFECLDGANQGLYLVSAYIPKTQLGNCYLREFGIFTPENQLIFIGHLDEFYKPAVESEKTCGVLIQVYINWGFNYGIELPVNEQYTYATLEDIKVTSTGPSTKDGSMSKAYLYYLGHIR